MIRRLLNLLTALSLLLCVTVAVVWAGCATMPSNVMNLPIDWSTTPRDHWAIMTGRYQLGVTHTHEVDTVRAPPGLTAAEDAAWAAQFGRNTDVRLLGFAYGRRIHTGRARDGRAYYGGWEGWVGAPYAAVLLATACPPALWWVRRRRRRRRAEAPRFEVLPAETPPPPH